MIVAYLRKSRADMEAEALGELETLARHERILDQLASKNGVHIERYYREIVSGESLDARIEMQQLIEDMYAGIVTEIYVVEIERLGRGNTKDQGIIFEALKDNGTLIVTPLKTYDPNDPYDEEYLEFALFMSRREYKAITRRMQAGKLQAVKEGNYVGTHAPYGYDIWKPDRDTRTLKANDRAQYVKMIYHWFTEERMSPGAIARRLTTLGIPTERKATEWNRSTINNILTNDVYAGKIRWFNRVDKKSYRTKKKVKPRTKREDLLIVEGKHDGLISEETFERALSLFNNAPVSTSKEISNVLAGLLKCKKCGRAMAMQTYKNGARTRFVHAKSMKCKCKSGYYDEVIKAVIEGLQVHLEDFEFKMSNDAAILEQKQKEKELEALKNKLAELIKQRAKQFEYLEKEIYSEAEFNERRAEVTAQMEEVETLIANYTFERKDYGEEVRKFSEVLESLKDKNIPAKHQNALLKDIVERIEYTNECGNPSLNIICR